MITKNVCLFILNKKECLVYCISVYSWTKMASWTVDHDVLLSCLLDDVTGTEEIVQLRKDKCAIKDCLLSVTECSGIVRHWHFTCSKSEGLELAGVTLNSDPVEK